MDRSEDAENRNENEQGILDRLKESAHKAYEVVKENAKEAWDAIKPESKDSAEEVESPKLPEQANEEESEEKPDVYEYRDEHGDKVRSTVQTAWDEAKKALEHSKSENEPPLFERMKMETEDTMNNVMAGAPDAWDKVKPGQGESDKSLGEGDKQRDSINQDNLQFGEQNQSTSLQDNDTDEKTSLDSNGRKRNEVWMKKRMELDELRSFAQESYEKMLNDGPNSSTEDNIKPKKMDRSKLSKQSIVENDQPKSLHSDAGQHTRKSEPGVVNSTVLPATDHSAEKDAHVNNLSSFENNLSGQALKPAEQPDGLHDVSLQTPTAQENMPSASLRSDHKKDDLGHVTYVNMEHPKKKDDIDDEEDGPSVGEKIKERLVDVKDGAKEYGSQFAHGMSKAVETVKEGAAEACEVVKSSTEETYNQVKFGIQHNIDNLSTNDDHEDDEELANRQSSSGVGQRLADIKEGAKDYYNQFTEGAANAFQTVKEGASDAVEVVKNSTEETLHQVKHGLQQNLDKMAKEDGDDDAESE